MAKIQNGTRSYQVGDCVFDGPAYRLYVGVEDGVPDREVLLQVAAEKDENAALERAAFILQELKRRSGELEKEYESVRDSPEKRLNYDLFFPQFVDSFVCSDQGDRRINVVAFKNVPKVSSLVPLCNIVEKDKLRVDLRTSAWILGKALKLLTLTQSEGIALNNALWGNWLIYPEKHYVIALDWTMAEIFSAGIPEELCRQEIADTAQAIIAILGGNLQEGTFPKDDDKDYSAYTDHLLYMAQGNERSAKKAHDSFYGLVNETWERAFYPFTTHPIKEE